MIFLQNRVDLTPEEFLNRCAMYDIDPRRKGNRVWFYSPQTTRTREGSRISPVEAAHFVVEEYLTEQGKPILHFIGDLTDDALIGVSFTREGRAWRDNHLAWKRRILGRQLPKKWTVRRSHHAHHINRRA